MAKIAIGYPALDDPRGSPQIGQNRQAQFFSRRALIYPYLMASAATALVNSGHQIIWSDGQVESQAIQKEKLMKFRPDWVVWEVKTPMVKPAWYWVERLKLALPETRFVFVGDHVTALPLESIFHGVDYVVTGGDYDFSLAEFFAYTEFFTYPPRDPVWKSHTNHALSRLSLVDRKLVDFSVYGGELGSGNYLYLPGTHSMVGRDCWYRHEGGCTFCSWTNTFKNWRVAPVAYLMRDLEQCASLGIRECFDDTGTFPIGSWLHDFCRELSKFNGGKRHGHCRMTFGCNMRPGALKREEYIMMAEAGFRFILFGLESAHQKTLDRINKGQKPGDLERSVRWAKEAGLMPHVTCMVGYPWETLEEAVATVEFTKRLFEKGWIDTLQATIIIPYPGTRLFDQAKKEEWLLTEDWDDYDMRRPVMKIPYPAEDLLRLTRGIYTSFLSARFLSRKLWGLYRPETRALVSRAFSYLKGHLHDFTH